MEIHPSIRHLPVFAARAQNWKPTRNDLNMSPRALELWEQMVKTKKRAGRPKGTKVGQSAESGLSAAASTSYMSERASLEGKKSQDLRELSGGEDCLSEDEEDRESGLLDEEDEAMDVDGDGEEDELEEDGNPAQGESDVTFATGLRRSRRQPRRTSRWKMARGVGLLAEGRSEESDELDADGMEAYLAEEGEDQEEEEDLFGMKKRSRRKDGEVTSLEEDEEYEEEFEGGVVEGDVDSDRESLATSGLPRKRRRVSRPPLEAAQLLKAAQLQHVGSNSSKRNPMSKDKGVSKSAKGKGRVGRPPNPSLEKQRVSTNGSEERNRHASGGSLSSSAATGPEMVDCLAPKGFLIE